jgi:hypothetical protein
VVALQKRKRTHKKINANPQILGSAPEAAQALIVNSPALASVAVAIDAAEEKLYFVRLKKAPSWFLCDLFGEVDYKYVAE